MSVSGAECDIVSSLSLQFDEAELLLSMESPEIELKLPRSQASEKSLLPTEAMELRSLGFAETDDGRVVVSSRLRFLIVRKGFVLSFVDIDLILPFTSTTCSRS